MTASNVAAIILAAGKGTRMKSPRHKVLHPLGATPMLGHILAALEPFSPARQVVIVGAGRDQLEAYLGARAKTAVQDPQLGTGHAVLQAREALADFTGDVLILYGDVPLIRT
ncbi:MAG: NTP transferase domain-containing protein, partial [Sphingomonadales bacterium]